MKREQCAEAPGIVLELDSQSHHNHAGFNTKKQPKKIPNMIPKAPGAVRLLQKEKETTQSSLAQIAKCNLTVKSIHSGIQDSLRRRAQPTLCPVMTEQVETGWGVGGGAAAVLLVATYSARRLGDRARGTDRDSFIRAGLIAPVSHRDAFDNTATGRSACSACVPHGALRASDCQSPRPFVTRGALRGSVPSLCRPAPRLLRRCQPARYFTSTAPWTLLFHCNPTLYTTNCVMGYCNTILGPDC